MFPEFVAKVVREWIVAVGAKPAFIEPGSPWENGYCERFNSKLRDELLNRVAHPGFNDIWGFGRRQIRMRPLDLEYLVTYQIGALIALAQTQGA